MKTKEDIHSDAWLDFLFHRPENHGGNKQANKIGEV